MESKSELVHLVSFPAQGHVNPLLRLGNRLDSKGFLDTFSTPRCFGKQMMLRNNACVTHQSMRIGDGLIRFESLEDEWEEDDPRHRHCDLYIPQLELVGRKVVPRMIRKLAEEGRVVACIIHNPLIPWVFDVVIDLRIPYALLWVQSCAASLFTEFELDIVVQLPCTSILKYDKIPTCHLCPSIIVREKLVGDV